MQKNIFITFAILVFFCIAAFVANTLIDYNYMFLRKGDGTPYDIVYNLVGGNQILYPVSVISLFLFYISAFYGAYFYIKKLLGRFKQNSSTDSDKESLASKESSSDTVSCK